MCKVYAICNQKGGCSKTSVTLNLGVGLAMEGKRVALIDADPQGSLTISLGYSDPDELPVTLATIMTNIIEENDMPDNYGMLHHQEGIELIPANMELSGIEVSLANTMSREMILKEYIEIIRDRFDYLGGNEAETHKYMTEMLGKYTVGKQSKGESAGKSGSSSSNYDVIGRDLLTPDEVRKMDNSKCLIFIRGFDPIMDDKFHTLESDEFALSTSLGMYDGKKEKDEAYEEEQVHFYIDAEGEDALEKSYRYQLENYGGIFKESNVFSHLEKTQEGLYKISFEYGGYMLKYESGQTEVLPAFDPLGIVRIHAGGAILSKVPVCGY